MKRLLAAFALTTALTAAAAPAQALDIPDLYRMTGCTKDGQTASTHVGIFNSTKNHDETRAVLNRYFREVTRLFTGAQTEGNTAYDQAVMDGIGKAVTELGGKASATASTFYSGLKKGCALGTEPLAPGQNHP